ncbi:MAG: DUF3299 domain-containing protein [Planctomycetales bacterium]
MNDRQPCSVIVAMAACMIALNGCGDSRGANATQQGSLPDDRTADAPGNSDQVPAKDPTASDAVSVQTVSRSARNLKPRVGIIQSISFDDIKFDMDKNLDFDRSMIDKKIERLDGKSIQIRGYMFPSYKQNGLTEFVLVRDNMECCFGPGAALYDCISVRMQEGKTTSYSYSPVSVKGMFSIRVWEIEGQVLAIYHLDADSVE